MSTGKTIVYRNAMETLVAEEIERQFQMIPPRLAKYLNKQEASAFALNRLPPLYATSESGWRKQCVRGRRDYGQQIAETVRQGLQAVQRDPLRMDVPLSANAAQESEVALQELRTMLKCPDLDWKTLTETVHAYLIKACRGEITFEEGRLKFNRRVTWNSSLYRQ